MPFDTTRYKLTAPVSIHDLQVCFGTGINVVAPKNDVGKCLCKMPDINKWSLHKPVRWPYVDRSAIQKTAPTAYSQWWLGQDENYGIAFEWLNLNATGANTLFTGDNYYTYQYIDGNSGHFGRLTDYDGYVHVSQYPNIGNSSFPVRATISMSNFSLGGTVSLLVEEGVSDGTLVDFRRMTGNVFYGVVFRIKKAGQSTYEYKYASMATEASKMGTTNDLAYNGSSSIIVNTFKTTSSIYALTIMLGPLFGGGVSSAYNNAVIDILPVAFNGEVGDSASQMIPLFEDAGQRESVMRSEKLTIANQRDVGYKTPVAKMDSVMVRQDSSKNRYYAYNAKISITNPEHGVSTTYWLNSFSILVMEYMEDEKYERYLTKSFYSLEKSVSDKYLSFTLEASGSKTVSIPDEVWAEVLSHSESGYTPTGESRRELLITASFSGLTNTTPQVTGGFSASLVVKDASDLGTGIITQ